MIDISDVDRVPLRDAVFGAFRFCRALLMTGGDTLPARPMLWSTSSEINASHEIDSNTPDIDIYCIHNGLVGGSGAHVKADGRIVYADGAYPYHIKYHIEHEILAPLWDFADLRRKKLEIAFVITNYNYIWGHWLTEMYPKLFIIKLLSAEGMRAPILLPIHAPRYISHIISLTLPGQEIIYYDHLAEMCEVGCVIIPHMYHKAYAFHHCFRFDLERVAARYAEHANQMLFISRKAISRPNLYRYLENADEIEFIAASFGLRVISPETMPWDHQIRAFSSASLLVGEYGSGLHNAILSPRGTKIVSLNWVGNSVQSFIARFRHHDLGYILPSDGIARIHNKEEIPSGYSIDPIEFGDKLGAVVSGLDLPAPRPSARSTVTQRVTGVGNPTKCCAQAKAGTLMRRDEVLNQILSLFSRPDYLEVGVNAGETFFKINAPRKVAVDPHFVFDLQRAREDTSSEFHETTSDAFFSTHSISRKFDVIYLDGLHTSDQIVRDLLNAVLLLNEKGVIVIDDVLPNSFHASLPDLEAATLIRQKLYPESQDHSWMGDVFRVVYFIKSYLQQFSYATVGDNHGQLVVWRHPRIISDAEPVIKAMSTGFDSLLTNEAPLNKMPMSKIMELLASRF